MNLCQTYIYVEDLPYFYSSCFMKTKQNQNLPELKIEGYSSINMSEDQLINLATVCIEPKYAKKINSEDIVDKV